MIKNAVDERAAPTEKNSMSTCEPIPWAKPNFWGKEQEYVAQALASNWISGGSFVDRFERDFAQYQGARHATTSSNGTTAIHMAFLALGVRPGDEVIVPGFAFMAAANMAIHLGAKPIFADVDPATWCITAEGVEKCLSPRTKVVVPVHTYGNVCPVDEILNVIRGREIALVEDVAEAFSSRYKNQLAGTMGVVNTFSFQATKTITTGEGGMVTTNDQALQERMHLFRNHGVQRKRYWHEVAGHNFRLTNMQAAIGCGQLEKIETIISERRRVYHTYQKCLSGVRGVTMQRFSDEVDPVVWAIAVKLDPQAYPQGRNSVMEQLGEFSIETRNGFYAASLLEHIYACPRLPICEDLSRQVISLPTYPTLEERQIQLICSRLKDLCK